jgi:hypothetical protein
MNSRYVVCVRNDGYPVSLELRKLYLVIADNVAAGAGFLRIVDESGEDYLYSADRFAPVHVPDKTAQALSAIEDATAQ